jgi:beta-galactosidase/beta-glucuronidase
MNLRLLSIAVICIICSCTFAQTSAPTTTAAATASKTWAPAKMELPTRWSKLVSPTNALPEYPRPQMTRKEWQNLNGLWDYAITDSAAQAPTKMDGEILVPFAIESALSGVKKTLQPNQRLWYSRTIHVNDINKRTLLHFGAVDWQATVWVNGKEAGIHTGGYNNFSLDITNAVVKGDNKILIKVYDPTDQGPNPHGKQVLKPQGIMYTSTSGIWQTAWLESVPKTYIEALKCTPDVDKSQLHLTVNISGAANTKGYTIEASANNGNIKVTGNTGTQLTLTIPNPHLWSTKDPFLYDLKVRLLNKGKAIDEVGSYFGMRKIEIKKDGNGVDRIFLNNQYTYNNGVLDQGFWPDGIYTAPTDDALKFDIEAIKSMGFNTIRKHIKVEPARWYYHCDKLGMLVWQDMPYPANLDVASRDQFEKENAVTMQQLHNYPSIICWVLFNEGWNRYDQQRLTEWMKKTDPSRLTNGHSGENYDRGSPKEPEQKWISSDLTDVHIYPGPGIAPVLPNKALVLGEWGGVRVATPGHQWKTEGNWGYISSSAADFARKYDFMVKHLKLFEEEGLSASIYTQPFDVEIEENGLITYDRDLFKIPVEKIKAINSTLIQ